MGTTWKAQKVARELTKDKVFYDPDFNRKRGNWTNQMKRDAIHSYSRGWVTANIVLAEISKCLAYVEKTDSNDNYSIQYYKKLLEDGYVYVGLDGQHKTEDTLVAFFNDQFEYSGPIKDADGKIHNIENKHYKNLPRRAQDAIRDMDINITIYEEESAKELPLIFSHHQKGEQLTDQEKRHAITTPIAPWVRKNTESISSCFSKLLSKKQIRQSGDRELYAKYTMVLDTTTERDLSSKAMDSYYEIGAGNYALEDSDYNEEELKRAKTIISQFSQVISSIESTKVQSNVAWALLLAIEYIYDKDEWMIGDRVAFFNELEKLHQKLKTNSHSRYAKACNDAESKNEDLPPESSFYHKRVTVPHQSENRIDFKKELRKAIDNNRKKLHIMMLPVSGVAADVA